MRPWGSGWRRAWAGAGCVLLAGLACGPAPARADDLPPLPPTAGPPTLPPLPEVAGPSLPPAIVDQPQITVPPASDGLEYDAARARGGESGGLRPFFLRRPVAEAPPAAVNEGFQQLEMLFRTPVDPPLGFTGRSSVLPSEGQENSHFVPVEDRWRIGFPAWDRYDRGHPITDDYPYMLGRILDPYNQNVLKGDYPIIGQHTFLDITAQTTAFIEPRQVPTATTPFESTARPNEQNFFGRPNQLFYSQYFSVAFDLFHGDAAFKPVDWRIKLVPTFNVNNLSVEELAVVSPSVAAGTTRTREFWALQEAFVEAKLADLSPDYDFLSVRAGNQPFVSDFRGFLFADVNRAVRIFGTNNSNRDQFNLAYFRQWEKDTNSFLNTFNDRRQNLLFANMYRQDFLFPGYTAQLSLTYNNDPKSFKFDKNRFLVRPDPVGIFQPHDVNVGYFGWAGDGHMGRFNLTHQFYWAFGYDSLNPLANRAQTINAQMFAIEGSYDRDWARFRISFFWSSGDHNINNSHATGFDTILDAPNFAGGPFSYWNRQQIPLFGVNLVQRLSLVPDLRSSKLQGQANFVNPGLLLPTLGADFDLTPKLKMINNCNILWFDQTNVLEQFLFDSHIDKFIGFDLSMGFEYRPLLNENISMIGGVSTLIPGMGFRDLYNNFSSRVDALVAGFMVVTVAY
jgi:hypothetical protein